MNKYVKVIEPIAIDINPSKMINNELLHVDILLSKIYIHYTSLISTQLCCQPHHNNETVNHSVVMGQIFHLDKMAAILTNDIFKCIWMKTMELKFRFHINLFPRVQFIINNSWFRQWLDAEQVTSHYLKKWWPTSLTHICGTRRRWVLPCAFILEILWFWFCTFPQYFH